MTKKKKFIYGHSSQLSSQKLLCLQPLNNNGSFLPSASSSGSIFTVPSPLAETLSTERRVNAPFCETALSKQVISRKTAFWFTPGIVQSRELCASAWSGSTQPRRPQNNCFRTTTCPSPSACSRAFHRLPWRAHSGNEESHRVHSQSLSVTSL